SCWLDRATIKPTNPSRVNASHIDNVVGVLLPCCLFILWVPCCTLGPSWPLRPFGPCSVALVLGHPRCCCTLSLTDETRSHFRLSRTSHQRADSGWRCADSCGRRAGQSLKRSGHRRSSSAKRNS